MHPRLTSAVIAAVMLVVSFAGHVCGTTYPLSDFAYGVQCS